MAYTLRFHNKLGIGLGDEVNSTNNSPNSIDQGKVISILISDLMVFTLIYDTTYMYSELNIYIGINSIYIPV